MRAWLFQDPRQKKKLGEKKCPWSVGRLDPDGKRKSKRIGSKSMAEKFRRKTEGELAAGTYREHSRKQWDAFRGEYEENVACNMKPSSRVSEKTALDHFERLAKPKLIRAIKTSTIDGFVARRRPERGLKKGSTVSVATINRELRHLKVVLRVAHEYKYLAEMPKIRMLKEPEKLPTYVTPEHFEAIYEACDSARLPKGLAFSAGEWWRALVVFTYLTGWRIGEPLALRREDLDLAEGAAITRYDDNKGCRDELVPLHSVVVEHLLAIRCFDPMVFPWPHSHRALWSEFDRIQKLAGIDLPCHGDHEHTEACYCYGFHDLRRAFATTNADTMTADALQKLMRHKDYSTTQRYINIAGQLRTAVDGLRVPDVLTRKTGS